MSARLKLSFLVLAILLAGHTVARTQQNPYRLKDPDQRKLCVECHGDFEQTLKKRFVHTAVKAGDCSGCHNPHVSSHGKLLSASTAQMCAGCHASVVPANAKSTHKVVADGECSKCHDPHASDNPDILVARGDALCASCHKDVGDAIAKAKFRHSPVQQGCTSCHVPHASEQSATLLKTAVPALCVGCHKPDGAAFVARHRNYPVARASCTTCHDPHGSDQPGMLLNTVHPPLSTGTCTQCHEAPGAAAPFAIKQSGFDLCKTCHGDMVKATMAQARLHWPVADQNGCANCHNPHASKHAGLLKASAPTLCGTCHADTARRIAGATAKHAPVSDGMCTACHAPHAASGLFLLTQPTLIETCAACHDYEQHSRHPIGPEAVDPRNKNLRIDCLSCHNGHGTSNKHMLLAPTNIELCTPCHKEHSR